MQKKLAYIKKKYYLCTEFRKQPIINLLKERKKLWHASVIVRTKV